MVKRLLHFGPQFITYQLPALLWGLLIYIASSIPSTKLPKLELLAYDKLIHIIIFFVFGLLVYRALQPLARGSEFFWRRILITMAIVISYGIVDELHQGTVPGRTLDIWDLVADIIGGVLSAVIYFITTRIRNASSPERSA